MPQQAGRAEVLWTASALADLDAILAYTAANHPAALASLEERVRAVVAHVARWPEGARVVEQRPEIRVVPLVRYPFRIFYRFRDGRVEILHIHHAARDVRE